MEAVTDLKSKLERSLGLLGIEEPVLALYDTDNLAAYEPTVRPKAGQCCWEFANAWRTGETLVISKDNYGCPGAGRYFLGIEPKDRDLAKFLYEGEGLKASLDITKAWIENTRHHRHRKEYALVGPFRPDRMDEVSTVTFLVDPDQLSALITAAEWRSSDALASHVLVLVSSGCGLLDPFEGTSEPRAVIGALDMAMRPNLPRHLMAFTVNAPMLRQLIEMDETSFLHKPFWQKLKEARSSE
jgi:hypothetical protein